MKIWVSSLMCVYWKADLERVKDRERSVSCFVPQMPTMMRARTGHFQEPRVPSESPTWVSGAAGFGPTAAALPGSLLRSWVRSGGAGAQTSAHLSSQAGTQYAAKGSPGWFVSNRERNEERDGAGVAWRQKPRAPPGSPTWVADAKHLCHLLLLLGEFIGSWIRSCVARTQARAPGQNVSVTSSSVTHSIAVTAYEGVLMVWKKVHLNIWDFF